MPRIVKGGKYIYGVSTIHEGHKIFIPDEAVKEYQLYLSDKLILMSGSKASGGFSLSLPGKMHNSGLSDIPYILKYNANENSFLQKEGAIIMYKKRLTTWLKFNKDNSVMLPLKIAKMFNLKKNDSLIVVKGGNMGPGFIAKGLIYKEAINYGSLIEI